MKELFIKIAHLILHPKLDNKLIIYDSYDI